MTYDEFHQKVFKTGTSVNIAYLVILITGALGALKFIDGTHTGLVDQRR